MAVAITTTDFPEGTSDLYKRVFSEVNLADDPPEGLVFHWAGDVDGKFTVTDIWETRQANHLPGSQEARRADGSWIGRLTTCQS